MDAFICIEGVSKTFNQGMPDEMRALTDVSLSIGRGEAVVLRGPSGSGKTSLLGIVGCMSRPTAGKVIIESEDVAKLPERFLTGIRRKRFGFIFQQFNLIRDLSVLDNLLLPLYPQDIGSAEMFGRAESLLKRFGIAEKETVKVKRLSGGEQQRVAIARALINRPDVVIADEPSAHLDRKLATELAGMLEQFHRDGTTLIIATHDPFLCEQEFVQKIVEMKDGGITGVSAR